MTIENITNSVKNTLNSLISPAQAIPLITLLCASARKPGLSTIRSVGNIIAALSRKGIPTEPNADGTPNLMNKMIYHVVDEIYRAIREDMSIQIVIGPGTITASGYGTATNVNITRAYGGAS